MRLHPKAATLAAITTLAAGGTAWAFDPAATRWLGDIVQAGTIDLEALKAAIAAKADVNQPLQFPFGSHTPLAYAVAWQDAEAVRILLEAGAGVNGLDHGWGGCRDAQGNPLKPGITPLMLAVCPGFARQVAGDSHASLALTAEQYPGSRAMVRQLVEAGADLDAQDALGHTALMLAVLSGQPELVEELMLQDARTGLKTKAGRTVSQLAPGYQRLARAGAGFGAGRTETTAAAGPDAGRSETKAAAPDRTARAAAIQTHLHYREQVAPVVAAQTPLPRPLVQLVAGYLFADEAAEAPAVAGDSRAGAGMDTKP
jgi:hypothetical protein